MSRMTVQSWLALILAGTLTLGLAASGKMIGAASAGGPFQVDDVRVSGHSTIFDGARLRTAESSSRIHLKKGIRMLLGPDSQATVMAGRLLLEKGLGELQTTADYRIEARTLKITPAVSGAIARVLIDGERAVRVEAKDGPVKVFNHEGYLVARVDPGSPLSFEPQAAPEGSFQMEGCLVKKQGKYVLVDLVANQVVELRGQDLERFVCNRVKAAGNAFGGATPVEGASQVIQVGSITQSGVAGCLAAAQQVKGADPCKAMTGNKSGSGGEHSHTGVYVGVAVAAAGGIGAAVALAGKKSSSP